jgi:lysophospholipase L1-like esterase
MAPTGENRLADGTLTDATLRQIIRPSLGGQRIRLRLSNLIGTQPLPIVGVTIARAPNAAAPAIDAATLRAVTFDGGAGVTIPAGADYLSDPVDLPAQALHSLAISIRYGPQPTDQTSHPGSRATSYIVKGDALRATDLPGATPTDHWFQLSGLEVERCVTPRAFTAAIVVLGDSITDGHGATTNGNDRWTDRLAERLQADPRFAHLSVVNQGIGGNRLLNDGLGPNALARLDRDVLVQPGARYLLLLEGVNDLGTLTRDAPVSDTAHSAHVARIIGAYRQIIARAHARGIKVIGATILPYAGSDYYHPDAKNEADRLAVNIWIRTPGHFDAIVDFDAITRDPARPDHLRADYDKGDGLHPSPKGYRAMADAIPLTLFQ